MDTAPNPPIVRRARIDFRRTRDAGAVVNTAFEFLRENWRGLFRSIALVVGPIYIVLFVLQALLVAGDMFLSSWFISMAHQVVVFAVAQTVIVGYMLLYMEKGRDGVAIADVRRLFRSDVLPVLGVTTLTTIACVLAGFLLIIPGIYLVVATSVSVQVRMAEESTVGSAISRSMDLVRDNWWQTFGVALLGLIVGFLMRLVTYVPTYLAIFFSLDTVGDHPVVFALLTMLIEAIAVLITAIIFDTTLTVQYFNLVELKEGPGMLERIEQIGLPEGESRQGDSMQGEEGMRRDPHASAAL